MQCNHGCGVVAATALSLLICDHFSRKVVLEKWFCKLGFFFQVGEKWFCKLGFFFWLETQKKGGFIQGPLITDGRNSCKWTGPLVVLAKTFILEKFLVKIFEILSDG